MPYCPDCGVEIGDALRCPLCGAPNPRAGTGSDTQKPCMDAGTRKSSELHFIPEVSEKEFSSTEKRTIAWEVLSVAFGIAMLVLAAVNLFESRRFSWSLYPIASMLLLWVEGTALLVLKRNPILRAFLALIAPPAFLVALGFITRSPRWALGLAVPIAVLTESLAGAVFLAIGKSKQKGLNVIAYVLVAIAALCIGLEICIDLFSRGAVVFDWAPICTISLLPIAAFLLYLHYRVAKTTNLRRLFHL
ncbi:MAG TPA: hypothetical protein DDZ37_02100 [Spirochaetaceae bacterium]|nr:hypothetical protein [Spirochaetaceae bacterium]